MNKFVLATAALAAIVGLSACVPDAQMASHNLSKAADMFEIDRRVVFYNGITDTYMLTIEGRCSIEDQGNQLEVTCKIGDGAYKKHFLGLSDNVTYFVEQLDVADGQQRHIGGLNASDADVEHAILKVSNMIGKSVRDLSSLALQR